MPPRLPAVLLLALGTGFLAISGRAGQTLQVGAASRVITPRSPAPLAGYYHPRESTGVLDDLRTRVMVLEDGERRAALVTLDLITTTSGLTAAIREHIEATTGIPGSHVMVSATHAHTGPELGGNGAADAALPQSTSDAARRAERFTVDLPATVAAAASDAVAARVEVRLTAGRDRCEGVAFNRRFHMRDGSVGWNPGKGNPDILQAAGPVDPDLQVVLARSTDGRPVAAYVHFALHPDTTGGSRISADYPGLLEPLLAAGLHPGLQTLFGNGTCGNVNHIDVHWDAPQSGPTESRRIATLLAASALRAVRDAAPLAPARLAIRGETVLLPTAPVSDAEVDQARIDIRTARDTTRDGFLRLVRAHQVLAVAAREGRPLPVEVQVIAAGPDLAWVSLPGEVFVELGLRLKRASPFRHTLPVELANGSIGYIPDLRAHAEGNYEVISSRCAPGAGERLIAAALRLLAAAHREVSDMGAAP